MRPPALRVFNASLLVSSYAPDTGKFSRRNVIFCRPEGRELPVLMPYYAGRPGRADR
jgi:hypothetical protein